ncbi:ribonuclease domain-containing protein [Olsenella sp. YH-ols2223]|uniref:Ribonuclease n=1 Tax=Olsenella absiana TaxID=3115222 RepID=A0ABU7R908_9ACTN
MSKRWAGSGEHGTGRERRASGRAGGLVRADHHVGLARARRVGAVHGGRAGLAAALFVAISTALVALSLGGCGAAGPGTTQGSPAGADSPASERQDSGQATQGEGTGTHGAAVAVTRGEPYTSKEEVAAYLHEYGELPPNFISKTRARAAGWIPSEGNLDEVCPGKSIGGGVFHNDDHALPEAKGRTWRECDVDYHGGTRGPERIVYSDDGLIYYTSDHYRTFEQLY